MFIRFVIALLLLPLFFKPVGIVYATTIEESGGQTLEECPETKQNLSPETESDDERANERFKDGESINQFQSENKVPEEIIAKSLQLFPKWGNIESGKLVTGSELLPPTYYQFKQTAQTRWILNGVDQTNATSAVTISNNSTLRMTNIGIVDNRYIDAIWIFGQATNLSHITLESNKDIIFWRVNATTPGHVPISIRHVYQDTGEELSSNIPLILDYSLSRNMYFEIEQQKLYALFSSIDTARKWEIASRNNNYFFERIDTANVIDTLSFVMGTNLDLRLGFAAFTNDVGGSAFQPYRSGSALLDNNSGIPTIDGHKEVEKFLSRYSITQEFGDITNGSYDMSISFDSAIHKEMTVGSIQDQTGNDLNSISDITNADGEIQISLPAIEVAKLRGQSIEVTLVGVIDSTNEKLSEFLVEDYVRLPIEATTSYSPQKVSGYADTWARPWGNPVSQEISLNTSTTDLDPKEFVDNLDNKLEGDEPFVVGFSEERIFDRLEETSIDVIIESSISGIQNIIEVPITVIENKGKVVVNHEDKEGNTLAHPEELIGIIGEPYKTKAQVIPNYQLVTEPDQATGVFSEETIEVTYVYEVASVKPVNPLDPEIEIDPDNKPELPKDQGLLSIDFVSSFDFGSQAISVRDQIYYVHPQRLLNEDGTVNETEERPNYVQISDRRSENERFGWSLSVTQNGQFRNSQNHELSGARLHLTNQQFASAQGGEQPLLTHQEGVALVPGQKAELVTANQGQGTGTWIYRFGDGSSAGESVALEVPEMATPRATTYQTSLTWELSAVPANE
nr:WxL domain-containing protein [Enterococcus sp. DIV1298c]